jgi:hypothetical protein
VRSDLGHPNWCDRLFARALEAWREVRRCREGQFSHSYLSLCFHLFFQVDPPLALAVRENKPKIALMLLRAGADVNQRARVSHSLSCPLPPSLEQWGETSLMIAAEQGAHKCLSHLLDYGANMYLRKVRSDTDNSSD